MALIFLIGILVLFFLGGFFISKNKDLIERFFEAIIISLSVNILIGLALAVFGTFNSFLLWISLIFFIIISLILFLKIKGFKKESFLFKLDKIEALSLIIAFIVIFFLVFNVHYTLIGNPENFKRAETKYYPFPYHLDEWSHIAQTRYIMEEGGYRYVAVLRKYGFENEKFGILEKPKEPEPLQFERLSREKVRITGNFEDDEWVLFKERYWPRWKAYIGDKDVQVYPSNHELLLVKTIKGNEILLEYDVLKTEKIFGVLSLIGILGISSLFVFSIRRQKIPEQ